MSQRSSRIPARRSRRRESVIPLLIFCIAIIGIILLVSPKEITQRALNVSPDGSLRSVADGLRITEIMADNTSAFPDEYGNFRDWLEIANFADHPINVKGLA
ncbi:MAG TPA: hypothetical protein PKZ39_04805, partial [Clostridia bacterium]|nr:hypothetical protein [Clostridia bacterium]